MGCSSSIDFYEPKIFENKTLIWFLGGGPGAPKQQVAKYLIERYKFKYLSIIDLIHFEESANSPQSSEVKKTKEQKKQFSSNLVVRILKKVLNLFGPRKYLIDNFPRNQTDMRQFENLNRKYQQIQFYGYLQLDLNEVQMRDNGIKTLTELKKEQTSQNIEKEVRTVIQAYRNKSKYILDSYQEQGKLIQAKFVNDDLPLLLETVSKGLSKKDISPVNMIPFYFLDGNDQDQVYKFSLKLAKLFGLKYWSFKELIDEAKTRPQFSQYISTKKVEQLESNFVVELISKKLQKFNYKGKYLISGFPRNQADIGQLKVKFRAQINIAAYAVCLHTPATQKEKQAFQKIHNNFLIQEEIPSAIINSSQKAFQQIANNFNTVSSGSIKKDNKKVALLPMFKTQGQQYCSKLAEWSQVIDFDELIRKEIKADLLHSDLLNSCLTLNRTIPSYIASNIILERIQASLNDKLILIKGFPQSSEQLKIFISKGATIGCLAGIFIELKGSVKAQSTKEKTEAKLKDYEQMQKLLSYTCQKYLKVTQKSTYQQLKAFTDSI